MLCRSTSNKSEEFPDKALVLLARSIIYQAVKDIKSGNRNEKAAARRWLNSCIHAQERMEAGKRLYHSEKYKLTLFDLAGFTPKFLEKFCRDL